MRNPIGFKHDEWSDAQLQDNVLPSTDEAGGEFADGDDEDMYDNDGYDSEDQWEKTSDTIIKNAIISTDVAEHLEKFSSGGHRQQQVLPQEFLNYNMPWRESDESTDTHLDKFMPHSSSARYTHDNQVRTDK